MPKLLRSAFRNKSLTIINIIGLTLAIAVALFLTSYLQYEFSFDKDFKDADRIYRVLTVWGSLDNEDKTEIMPINLGALSERLIDEVPEIQYASRLYNYGDNSIRHKNEELIPLYIYEVDPSFVDIFSFNTLSGDAKLALKEPGSCVLTKSSAEKLFKEGIDPIGKQINWEGREIVILAVIEDLPANTHLNFDMLIPMDNIEPSIEYYVYYKLYPNADAKSAISKCREINIGLLTDRFSSFSAGSYFDTVVESVTSVHTMTKASWDLTPTIDRNNLILILLITIFILVIAIINFTSLYILQGENRSKEISIKKINGAEGIDIVKSLLSEITLIASISFIFGIILYFSLSNHAQLWTGLNIPPINQFGPKLWLYFILIFIIVILFSSIYPTQYLSRYTPAQLMQESRVRRYRMTVWSVVVQFSIVIFALSSLTVVSKQMKYVHYLPLGFNPENVMTTYARMSYEEYNTINSKLIQYPEILETAASQGNPISGCSGQGMRIFGQTEDANITVDERRCTKEFIEIYQIPIVEGENFSGNPEIDEWNLILSESTVKSLGLVDPVGKKVMFLSNTPFTVIGVAKDIHYDSAHRKIGDLVYSSYNPRSYTLSVRFAEGKYIEAKEIILSLLNDIYDDEIFNLRLVTDIVQNQYEKDKVTYRLLISGTIIAIVISLLGLLALSGFVARQKQKEVSVRRVYGAHVDEAVMSLNYFILIRILPAIPIGIIASWFLMKKWLGGFAYSIHLSWTLFFWAVLITLGLALLTTLFHSIKAAISNPAYILKRN